MCTSCKQTVNEVFIIDPVVVILLVMAMTLLLFLMCIFHIHMTHETRRMEIKQNSKTDSTPEKKPISQAKGKVTPDEFMKVMDFMLVMGVIDMKEYNQLIAKSIPHI